MNKLCIYCENADTGGVAGHVQPGALTELLWYIAAHIIAGLVGAAYYTIAGL